MSALDFTAHERDCALLIDPERGECDCRDDASTFCMQCEDPTTKKEGALCTLCAQQDVDANAEHEADHGPGRV